MLELGSSAASRTARWSLTTRSNAGSEPVGGGPRLPGTVKRRRVGLGRRRFGECRFSPGRKPLQRSAGAEENDGISTTRQYGAEGVGADDGHHDLRRQGRV